MKPLTFTCYVPDHVDTFRLRAALIRATQRFVNPTISCVAMAAKADADGSVPPEVRPPVPAWARWHRTANRLAPPGVSVVIRDRSGARVLPWAFGGPHKPPFSVKSWRFSYESDARHCERVWAEVDALRKSVEPVSTPTGHMRETVQAAHAGALHETVRENMAWILAELKARHTPQTKS